MPRLVHCSCGGGFLAACAFLAYWLPARQGEGSLARVGNANRDLGLVAQSPSIVIFYCSPLSIPEWPSGVRVGKPLSVRQVRG